MPRTISNTKKSYKGKKSYSKKKDPYAIGKSMSTMSGMPKSKRTVIRYNDTFQVTSTGGILSQKYFRANGPFDPDANLTSALTPPAFVNMGKLYNHSVVVASRMHVAWTNEADNNQSNPAHRVGCYLADDTSNGYTKASDIIMNRKGTSQISDWVFNNDSYTNFDAKRFFNITDIRDNFGRLGSKTDTIPTEQAVYSVWICGFGANDVTRTADVTIDYIVEFSEPKDLNPI